MGINIKKLRKQIRKNNIKLILFAEVHGLIDETYIQEKILREIKSDVFLYELLEEELPGETEEDFHILEDYLCMTGSIFD